MKCISGKLFFDEIFEGYVLFKNGIVEEIGEGKPPIDPCFEGNIFPGFTDTHTHIGDAGLVLDKKYTLEELVQPPNGLKHRYLESTPIEQIKQNISDYYSKLFDSGVSRIIDFREGGVEGSRMLREVCPNATIFGRPRLQKFDSNEMEDLLKIVDGIGISSLSDVSKKDLDSIVDFTHKKNKFFAIHVSERLREDFDKILSYEPDFVVHMCKATDDDFRKCSDHNIPIVVCPSSNNYFNIETPIKRMLDQNVNVAIGTDNAMLTKPDIFSELRYLEHIGNLQNCSDTFIYNTIRNSNNLLRKKILQVNVGDKVDFTVTVGHPLSGDVKRIC